jgi:hypothetical protein
MRAQSAAPRTGIQGSGKSISGNDRIVARLARVGLIVERRIILGRKVRFVRGAA